LGFWYENISSGNPDISGWWATEFGWQQAADGQRDFRALTRADSAAKSPAEKPNKTTICSEIKKTIRMITLYKI
jgi:hypothetical protein